MTTFDQPPARTPALVDERVAETLRTAATLIRTHGWLRGSYGDRGHGFCVEGAIMTAAHDLHHEQGIGFITRMSADSLRTFRRTIGEVHGPPWNDRLGRTVDDVYAALEDARLDALEKGVES